MGMKLQYNLENIGNIDKASIAIKPLTIIAGENSTGKTFVTKSLYTILNSVYQNHFSNKVISEYINLKHRYVQFFNSLTKPSLVDIAFEEKMNALDDKIYEIIFKLVDASFKEEEQIIFHNQDIFDSLENSFIEYFNERAKLKKFQKHIKNIETMLDNLANFIDIVNKRREVVIQSIDSSLAIGLKKNYQITDLKSLINRKSNQKLKLSIDTIGEIEVDLKSKLTFNFEGQGIEKVQKIENIVFFDSPVYIKIRKVLESNQKNTFLQLKDKEKYLKGYPEYLDKLYGFIDKEYIDIPAFNIISQEIQEKILGKLDVSKSGDITYSDNKGNIIPLSLTAMGISNIGLIDLLLRNNIINKGSFLIMDEPEVHLHPEWQVFLAKILYKISKAGANIIIATHSLDFLKAFENILKEENEIAEDIIAINKMPYDESFSNKTELEKVGIVLDDLSRPFYNLYMQDI